MCIRDSCGGSLAFPGTYIPLPTEENPCPEKEQRSCCVSKLALVLCDSASKPDTLTDPTDIEALKTANKMFTFPDVGVSFQTPTETTFKKPCGDLVLVRKEQLIDVDVYDVSEDHEDEIVFNAICGLNGKFGLIWQYTDGYTVAAKEIIDWFLDTDGVGTIPDMQLGVPATFSISPYLAPFNDDEPCHWKMQFKITYECGLKSALMPGFQGVF